MRVILEHFARAAVVRAMEANVHEVSALWGHALGAEFHDETDVTWYVSGLPFELCNGVIRAQFASENLERSIDATLKLLRIVRSVFSSGRGKQTANQVFAWYRVQNLIGPTTRGMCRNAYLGGSYVPSLTLVMDEFK